MNLTDPSFLGIIKAGAAHSEWFSFLEHLIDKVLIFPFSRFLLWILVLERL